MLVNLDEPPQPTLGQRHYLDMHPDPNALIIRPAEPEDAPAIAEIYAPFVLSTAISFETEPPDAAEMARRLSTIKDYPWLVCAQGTKPLGYAYASAHRSRAAYVWSTDVSVYLRSDAQGRGIGRRLYTALFEILRLQGFYNAYAGIVLPNAASEGLHRAMGFKPVGIYRNVGFKAGSWHDVGWSSLELQPLPRKTPKPPLSFSAVRASQACLEVLAQDQGG